MCCTLAPWTSGLDKTHTHMTEGVEGPTFIRSDPYDPSIRTTTGTLTASKFSNVKTVHTRLHHGLIPYRLKVTKAQPAIVGEM